MAVAKGARVRRLDSITLEPQDKTYFTAEGYLVDHPILTSCGIFEYLNDDGTTRRELRLPEYVFDKKSLHSYKGKPIIITHDAGVVDKKNVSREQIGTILSDGYKEGEDVKAEIIIHDTDSMKQSGLKELSLGYNLTLVEEPGEWNGEHYDAIQTDIQINHLALVTSARAGEQARLNIDSKDNKFKKGGRKLMPRYRSDADDLTPEQLQAAIDAYKQSKAQATPQPQNVGEPENADEEEVTDDMVAVVDNPEEDETIPMNPNSQSDVVITEEEDDDEGISNQESELVPKTPSDVFETVKSNKTKRESAPQPQDMFTAKEVIAQQDDDLDKLIACIEKLIADAKGQGEVQSQTEPTAQQDEDDTENIEYMPYGTEEERNEDCSEDNSQLMNMDSVDRIVKQRLAICRVGDKLNMNGLEDMSIKDGKRAIIKKVMPQVRLDGKSDNYLNTAFELALGEVNKRKDTNYQRKQMVSTTNSTRSDSADRNKSMASSARQRMIDRERGNN